MSKLNYKQQQKIMEAQSGIVNNDSTDDVNVATIGDIKTLALEGGAAGAKNFSELANDTTLPGNDGKEVIEGLDGKVNTLTLATQQWDYNNLQLAKDYTDAAIEDIIFPTPTDTYTKEEIDTKDTNTLIHAQNFAMNQDAVMFSASKQYTDNAIAGIEAGEVTKEYVDQQDALRVDWEKYNEDYANIQTQIAIETSQRVAGDNYLQTQMDRKVEITDFNTSQLAQDQLITNNKTQLDNLSTYLLNLPKVFNMNLNGVSTPTTLTTTAQQILTTATISLPSDNTNKLDFTAPNIEINTLGKLDVNIQANVDAVGGQERNFTLELRNGATVLATRTVRIGATVVFINANLGYNITTGTLPMNINLYAYDSLGTTVYTNATYKIILTEPGGTSSGGGGSTTDDITNLSTVEGTTLTNALDNIQETTDDIEVNLTTKIDITTYTADKAAQALIDGNQDTLIATKADETDLTNETAARINGDNNLSSRIGVLEAAAGAGGEVGFRQQFLIPSTYVKKRIGEGINSICFTNHPNLFNGDDLTFTNSNKLFRKPPGAISWVDTGITPPSGTQRMWNKDTTLYALVVTFLASNKFAAIWRSTDQGATFTSWKATQVNTSTSTGTAPTLAICRNSTHYFLQSFRGGSTSLLYNIWRIQDIETGAVVQMQYQFASTSGIDFFVANEDYIFWKEGSSIKRLKDDNSEPVITMTLPTPNFTIGTGGDVDDEGTLWIGNHNASNTKLFYANASTSYAFVGIELAYPLTTGGVFFFKDDTYKYIVATTNTAGSGDYAVLRKTIDAGTWETLGKSTLPGMSGSLSGFEIRGIVGYNPETKRVRTDSPGTKTTNYSFGL